jgi:hypothetical protein
MINGCSDVGRKTMLNMSITVYCPGNHIKAIPNKALTPRREDQKTQRSGNETGFCIKADCPVTRAWHRQNPLCGFASLRPCVESTPRQINPE